MVPVRFSSPAMIVPMTLGLRSEPSEVSCHDDLPDEVCPQPPSHSSKTSGERLTPRLATMNTRRRRWGTPKYRASRVRHETAYPSSSISRRRARKSRPSLEVKIPGTFSSTTHRGRNRSTRLRKVNARTDLLPSVNPLRFPATERSWQGNPALQMSAVFQSSLPGAPLIASRGPTRR